MFNRSGARVVFLALFLLLSIAGCDIGLTYDPPLRIASAPWIGYTPFYVARDRRLYGDMDVRIAEFSTDFDAARASADGRVELTCGTLSDVLRQRDQGTDLTIVAALDFSNGADGIVARPPIADVAGLRGKRVGAEIGTLTHFVLLRALERAKVDEREVTIVNVAMEQALLALEKGEVDAVSLWEPYLTKAEGLGGKRIFSSAEIPGEILDVLAARTEVLATRSGDIERVLVGWNGALDLIRRDPSASLPVMAAHVEMTVPDLKVSLATVELVDLKQNLRLFERAAGGGSVWDAYSRAATFMTQNKLVKGPPADADAVLNPALLQRAAAP